MNDDVFILITGYVIGIVTGLVAAGLYRSVKMMKGKP